MLCSIPTGKSGSNWLDRLRSNKGFPAADDLDLDRFLTNHHNSFSDSPLANPSNSLMNSNSESTQSDNKRVTAHSSHAAETSSESGDKQWFGAMTNVLCDLFNMGELNEKISRFSGKKSTRKQTNPKFCDVSTPTSANDIDSIGKDEYVQAATVSLHSDNNSNIGANANWDDDVDEEKEKAGGGGSGGSDRELKGYSRSEVTVIDTSFEVWKFDKLVFRRKNIWKVRDKKGKSWSVGTKKRKGNHLESGNGDVGSKKKAKTSHSEFGSSKDSNGGDLLLPSNDGQKPQDEKTEVCKDSLDDHFQVPKRRSPKKLKKNGSSVVLIKAIPTSKKCGRSLHKNHLNDFQRQYKA